MHNGSIPARAPPGIGPSGGAIGSRMGHNPYNHTGATYNVIAGRDGMYGKASSGGEARGAMGYASGMGGISGGMGGYGTGSESSSEMHSLTSKGGVVGPSSSSSATSAVTDMGFNVNEHDFPTLGGVSSVPVSNPGASVYAERAEDREFAMATEDFPALPGSKPTRTKAKPSSSAPTESSSAVASSSSAVDLAGADPYGLLYLLNVLHNKSIDLNILAGGIDLTTLGLSLNSPQNLHKTFYSPWSDASNPLQRLPPMKEIPDCFINHPTPEMILLEKLDTETLIYTFYDMPRDEMQLRAAQELYKRDWRYHKELQLWFSRDAEGRYWYFDIASWQRRQHTDASILDSGFMSPAELNTGR